MKIIDRLADETKGIIFALVSQSIYFKCYFFIADPYLSTLWRLQCSTIIIYMSFTGARCRRPQPHSEIVVASIKSQVSHSTTATTHRTPLDTYPDAALWECYWVRDSLLINMPWPFVEVKDHRDLRQNCRIFTSLCLHYFPFQCKGPSKSIEVSQLYQGPQMNTVPM